LGVDFGNVAVVLLDGLFQFCLFGVFVLAGFGGLAVELFGGELEEECVSGGDGYDGRCGGVVEGTFRLKRAFSRPDMMSLC
jgi:hypothetical protein